MRRPYMFVPFLLAASLQAEGQTPAVTEPQYVNQFDILGSDGQLIPLERETPKIEGKGGGFIAVKVKVKQTVPGAQSPVRTRPGTPFVVKMHTGDNDPATIIHLYKLDSEKNQRSLLVHTSSAIPFAGAKTSNVTPDTIPLAFEKYGDSSLKITTVQPLAPGEYAFSTTGQSADCFGVDAK